MTIKEYNKVLNLLKSLRKIPTWTSEKHDILGKIVEIMESGTHEYFTSHYQTHGKYVGLFYLNKKNHLRRGTLKKYRGKNIMVLCCGRRIGSLRDYIVSTIEGEIKIGKTSGAKIKQGFQPNIVLRRNWDRKTGSLKLTEF